MLSANKVPTNKINSLTLCVTINRVVHLSLASDSAAQLRRLCLQTRPGPRSRACSSSGALIAVAHCLDVGVDEEPHELYASAVVVHPGGTLGASQQNAAKGGCCVGGMALRWWYNAAGASLPTDLMQIIELTLDARAQEHTKVHENIALGGT